MDRYAAISDCGAYRYWLKRKWQFNETQKEACWIMLNPSTADAVIDDPTIRRCIAFSKAWGFNSLVVVNLFAYRSASPDVLKRQLAPIGPDNDAHIVMHARSAGIVIAAWGNDGKHWGRADKVRQLLKENGIALHHLGELTAEKQPRHPLYLKASLVPVPYE